MDLFHWGLTLNPPEYTRGIHCELAYVTKQAHYAIYYDNIVLDELVLEDGEIWRYE